MTNMFLNWGYWGGGGTRVILPRAPNWVEPALEEPEELWMNNSACYANARAKCFPVNSHLHHSLMPGWINPWFLTTLMHPPPASASSLFWPFQPLLSPVSSCLPSTHTLFQPCLFLSVWRLLIPSTFIHWINVNNTQFPFPMRLCSIHSTLI